MAARKTYGQFCALARALDHVGDRWALLVIRELLLGPARYGRLSAALPGLATNLLAQRLRGLGEDGIVEREGTTYRLTERGRALEPVVVELIRWGAVYMTDGPGEDVVDERWALLAMRALLTTSSDGPRGEVAVRCGSTEFAVVVDGNGRRVTTESSARPSATVVAPLGPLLRAVFQGGWGDEVAIDGDAAFARAVLTPAAASVV